MQKFLRAHVRSVEHNACTVLQNGCHDQCPDFFLDGPILEVLSSRWHDILGSWAMWGQFLFPSFRLRLWEHSTLCQSIKLYKFDLQTKIIGKANLIES